MLHLPAKNQRPWKYLVASGSDPDTKVVQGTMCLEDMGGQLRDGSGPQPSEGHTEKKRIKTPHQSSSSSFLSWVHSYSYPSPVSKAGLLEQKNLKQCRLAESKHWPNDSESQHLLKKSDCPCTPGLLCGSSLKELGRIWWLQQNSHSSVGVPIPQATALLACQSIPQACVIHAHDPCLI